MCNYAANHASYAANGSPALQIIVRAHDKFVKYVLHIEVSNEFALFRLLKPNPETLV